MAGLRAYGAAFTIVVVATQTFLFSLVYLAVVAGLDAAVIRGVDKIAFACGAVETSTHFSDKFAASLANDSAAAQGGRAAMAVIFFSTMPSAVITVPFYAVATPWVAKFLRRAKKPAA